MLPVKIAPEVKSACPGIRLGLLTADVRVQATPAALKERITTYCETFASENTTESLKQQPVVLATRAVYKALGKDPSRYRPSAEALQRRVVKGKGLYQVSNVVDLLNLVSLMTGFSIGGYDTSKIQGAVWLRRGGDDPYEGIGRGALNIEGLPVLYDEKGPFGSPTSDSARTMITPDCAEVTMVFFDFNGEGPLQASLEMATDLLRSYSASASCATAIV